MIIIKYEPTGENVHIEKKIRKENRKKLYIQSHEDKFIWEKKRHKQLTTPSKEKKRIFFHKQEKELESKKEYKIPTRTNSFLKTVEAPEWSTKRTAVVFSRNSSRASFLSDHFFSFFEKM